MFQDGNNGKKIRRNDAVKKEFSKPNKSNKFFQALSLPTISNINPRSIYNKLEEFHTFVNEEECDLIFLSESWERESLGLDKIINLEDHVVISNVSQRVGKGGRPAIIANHKKFEVLNLTNTLVQVPWGVEAVWCLLTPNNVTNDSRIQKIACCAVYSKPDSRKKKELLDHMSDAFNILSTKYGRGLHFVIAGDTNDLKLDSILSLSPSFRQIVKDWTRLDPPALLDPIITTLHSFYQTPICLPPLDSDPDKNGSKSDHRIVLAKPINVINNKSGRHFKKVKVRPFPQSGIMKMKEWFVDQTWEEVFKAETAHEKAELFQNILLKVLDEIFPERTRKISNDDQPWITHRLKVLDRKRKRIYRKERRSEKWSEMNKLFKKEMKTAKSSFYKKTVADLKIKNPSQWYSSLKRITSDDQTKQQVNIEEINHPSDQAQAELIADNFHPFKTNMNLSKQKILKSLNFLTMKSLSLNLHKCGSCLPNLILRRPQSQGISQLS